MYSETARLDRLRGVVSSFLRRRVQPLKERENYGFEYSGAEDRSRMVPALELIGEEVLERLQKMLKGVSVVPLAVLEYSAKLFFLMRVLFVFLLLSPLLLNLSCLVVLLFYRNWGVTLLIRSPLMSFLP